MVASNYLKLQKMRNSTLQASTLAGEIAWRLPSQHLLPECVQLNLPDFRQRILGRNTLRNGIFLEEKMPKDCFQDQGQKRTKSLETKPGKEQKQRKERRCDQFSQHFNFRPRAFMAIVGVTLLSRAFFHWSWQQGVQYGWSTSQHCTVRSQCPRALLGTGGRHLTRNFQTRCSKMCPEKDTRPQQAAQPSTARKQKKRVRQNGGNCLWFLLNLKTFTAIECQ